MAYHRVPANALRSRRSNTTIRQEPLTCLGTAAAPVHGAPRPEAPAETVTRSRPRVPGGMPAGTRAAMMAESVPNRVRGAQADHLGVAADPSAVVAARSA